MTQKILTDAQVREALLSDRSVRDLADDFRCSHSLIVKLRTRGTDAYAHVYDEIDAMQEERRRYVPAGEWTSGIKTQTTWHPGVAA